MNVTIKMNARAFYIHFHAEAGPRVAEKENTRREVFEHKGAIIIIIIAHHNADGYISDDHMEQVKVSNGTAETITGR